MAAKAPSADEPRIIRWLIHPTFQAVFAVVALITIIYFIAQFYILRPYDGMNADFYDGLMVEAVDANGPAEEAGIRAWDEILSINGRSTDEIVLEGLYPPGFGPGDIAVIEIQRDRQVLTCFLTIGSYRDNLLVLARASGLHTLALSFWTVGLVLCLFVPSWVVGPRLIGLCWLAIGTSVAATGPSGWVNLRSFSVIIVASIFALALFVISHLYFPVPSFSMQWRKRTVYVFTIVALLLSTLEIVEDWILPGDLLIADFVGIHLYDAIKVFQTLSFLIGVSLLVRGRFTTRDPGVRRQVSIILWTTALGGIPGAAVALFDLFASPSSLIYTSMITFFLLVPLAYAYVIYQRKLVRVDFVVNRAVVLFVFTLLTLIAATLALLGLAQALDLPAESALLGGVVAAVAALLAPRLRRAVQRRVDLVLYGCHYDFPAVTGAFAERLSQAADRQTLTHLLTQNLAQRMGIRRAALLLAEGDVLAPQPSGDALLAIPLDDAACRALLASKQPCRAEALRTDLPTQTQARWRPFEWAQLLAPLIYQERLHGVLLLGGRHHGDIYSDADLRIVAAVAHQGALAWENVRLVESLRALNRQLVRADETQRKQVARDLHDAALQQLFFARQGLLRDREEHAPLIELLDSTVRTLRRTIRGLRPPLLDQGLPVALEGLVDEMRRTAGLSPTIVWRSNTGDSLPLPDEQATALYRIAQEALANALKHAGAQQITVSLMAEGDCLRLCVADDGVGAAVEREGHYGLTGMRERAAMIGARLHVDSTPSQGTRVAVEVQANLAGQPCADLA